MELIRSSKAQLRQYAKETDANTFVCDIRTVCNRSGYVADDAKETKKFWIQFALDCIDLYDYEFIRELANFLNEKAREREGM